jgi:ATP-binding cassette subfamily B protein
MLASRLRINMMASITNKILLTIRQELYTHIQKLSFAFFDSRPAGKILARVIGDVNSLQQLFTNAVTSLIPELLTLICVGVIMFSMNARLALSAMAIMPLLMVGLFLIQTFSRRMWQSFRQKRSNMNAYTHEDFSGIRVVQSFAAEGRTSRNFVDLVTQMNDAFVSAVKLNDLFWPIVEISWGLGTCVVYWVSVKLMKTDTSVTIGTIVAFGGYIGMFWRPIMNLTNFYNTLITNFAAAERIFEILEMKPDIISIHDAYPMPRIKGQVEFKNITFGYEDGTTVLDNVSFKVPVGETIALVGATGAGKTTIVNLISRFYNTKIGEILIDGRNIAGVELESLRSQMGIMLQDTFLFSTTIKENIRYGKLDATDEEVMAAAKAVNAHEFIMQLENGYDTEVNERGSRLSVGQRQLISFARALLADPRILVLDEATSCIDTKTELALQEGLQRLLKGRTSFVIAHRLSTIKNANKIMYIEDGKIVEQGSHEELMALEGEYHKLYTAQYKLLEVV